MHPEEAHAYAGYGGSPQYTDIEREGNAQKLQGDSDEQFADLLARKIKQELKSEMTQRPEAAIGYRLALAIVSVCVLIPMFIGLIIALALGVNGAVVLGFIIACGVIFVVNAYFNWASIEISKHQK